MAVEVVAGILVRGERVLLVQRRADKDFPLTWECPGGKVEGREVHRDALQREWREELGVLVTSMESSPRFEREFSNPVSRPDRACIRLFLYRVEANGTPSPREGQGIGWFTAPEVMTLVAAPGLEAARCVVIQAMTGAF
jgi:mutator protein MutT